MTQIRRASPLHSSRQASSCAAFAAAIKAKVGRLQSFPQSGRVVPEFPIHGLREVIAADYRIVYRFMKSQNTVQILAVHHGPRLLDEAPTEE